MTQATQHTYTTTTAAQIARTSALGILSVRSGKPMEEVEHLIATGNPTYRSAFNRVLDYAIERLISAHADGTMLIRASSHVPANSILRKILK
jgi:hypothetical protein